MPLDEVRSLKAATGATVNDVVLSIAGGALRHYLEDRGELPDAPLLASVPVSVRAATQRNNGANKVSALFAQLATDIQDPLQRLEVMSGDNRTAKTHQQTTPEAALTEDRRNAA